MPSASTGFRPLSLSEIERFQYYWAEISRNMRDMDETFALGSHWNIDEPEIDISKYNIKVADGYVLVKGSLRKKEGVPE